MKKQSKKSKKEVFEMPSDESVLAGKKYLSELELKVIELHSKEMRISELNIENIRLKIKNTEQLMALQQNHLDKLNAELGRKVEEDKRTIFAYKENIKQIQVRHGIVGKFAYDPISGELITE